MVVAVGGQNVSYYEKTPKDIINWLNRLQEEGGYVFRGYNKAEQMYATVARNKKYIKKEKNLLYDFEYYAKSYINANCPIEFMSCAQHYGLPTRLIDYTYNPFIALYFALYDDKKGTKGEDRDYYYINFCKVEDNILLRGIYQTETTTSLAQSSVGLIRFIENLFNSGKDIYLEDLHCLDFKSNKINYEGLIRKIRSKCLLFIEPSQSNQRIIMQQGLFMFPYTLDEISHREILSRNTKQIIIPKESKKEMQRYLDSLGFNTYRLMPDLGSICKEISLRAEDDM